MTVKVYLPGVGCLHEYKNIENFHWLSGRGKAYSFTSEDGKEITIYDLPLEIIN